MIGVFNFLKEVMDFQSHPHIKVSDNGVISTTSDHYLNSKRVKKKWSDKMKGLCEAGCGDAVQVYGAPYCPDCHFKYGQARSVLVFSPSTSKPVEAEDNEYLLLNQCDGYHLATAMFDDQGAFECFHVFGTNIYSDGDFYCAWAKLPDAVKSLQPIFVKTTACSSA